MSRSKSKYNGAIAVADLAGNGLRAEFDWFGDRFSHQVYGVKGEKSTLLLSSEEGNPDELWPASPPLQEFNDPFILSDVNSGAVGIAVGATGGGYWSVGIDVSDKHEEEPPAMTFDVACRVRDVPEWLGSRYKLINATHVLCGSSQMDLESELGTLSVLLEMEEKCPELADSSIHVTNERLFLSCNASEDLQVPLTLRWRYRIEWRPQ